MTRVRRGPNFRRNPPVMAPAFLLRLLYISVAAILCTLAIVVTFALSQPVPSSTGDALPVTDSAMSPFAGDSLAADGSLLWKQNVCGSCHDGGMRSTLVGPALAGVQSRWADYPREDLYRWVRNSQRLIEEGHPRATLLWNNFRPTVMSNYSDLTDRDVEALLAYIDAVSEF